MVTRHSIKAVSHDKESTINRNEIDLTIKQNRELADDTPVLYVDAVSGKNKIKWQEAIKEELGAYRKNGTWQIADRPSDARILNARWIFTMKRGKEGQVIRYKDRLVARGSDKLQVSNLQTATHQ